MKIVLSVFFVLFSVHFFFLNGMNQTSASRGSATSDTGGFWYVYKEEKDANGRAQHATLVSNCFHSSLSYLKILKRVRDEYLNGYQGSIGGFGPFDTRQECQKRKDEAESGVLSFSVADPLE